MDMEEHYRRMEKMYHAAPINQIYKPVAHISDKACTITMEVQHEHFHAAHALHGSVYFKMLDDAAFFAANSVVTDVFVLTANFNIQLLRPVTEGVLTATGKLRFGTKRYFVADAELTDDQGRLVATGSGSFLTSRLQLNKDIGYGE